MTTEPLTQPDITHMRVDQVGSLLRPAYLKAALASAARGELTDDELRETQDQAIRVVVAKQEELGLPIVNDGEFRRWHFMECFEIAGLTAWTRSWTETFQDLDRDGAPTDTSIHQGANPVLMVREPVTERLHLLRNTALEEFQFAQSLTSTPVKVTMIGPDRITQGYDAEASVDVYPDADAFVHDLVAVERQIIDELREAGCRYVHIDEPGYTGYVDPPTLEAMRQRGEDREAWIQRSVEADNALVAGHPGVTFGTHLCRGNRQSLWHREGTYDGIAEQVFSQLAYDRFMLEYDSERIGTFAPLRFFPKGKMVVLGLVTTKTGQLEDPDTLVARIEEASTYLPVEQLALSPQCGFATDVKGNLLTEDDQWRKLELVLRTAERVWGSLT
jgi:5-methyltetrahydropteroyltriglutamate--homocysteine methyltransferase